MRTPNAKPHVARSQSPSISPQPQHKALPCNVQVANCFNVIQNTVIRQWHLSRGFGGPDGLWLTMSVDRSREGGAVGLGNTTENPQHLTQVRSYLGGEQAHNRSEDDIVFAYAAVYTR